MNVVSSPSPLAVLESSGHLLSSRTVLSFRARVSHQWRWEWRRQHRWVAVYWLILVFQIWLEQGAFVGHSSTVAALSVVLSLVGGVSLCSLTWRCMAAASPARKNLDGHLRPVGNVARSLAQVLFLTVALVLPWIAGDFVQALPYGLGPGGLLWLCVGSLKTVLALVLLTAAFTVISSSVRNLGTLLISAALAMIAETFLIAYLHSSNGWNLFRTANPNAAQAACAGVVFITLMAAASWLVQTLFRRTRWSLALLAGGCLLNPWLRCAWIVNSDGDQQIYRDAEVKLVYDSPDKAVASQGQVLWEGLAVAGLPPAQTATVYGFNSEGLRFFGYADSGLSAIAQQQRYSDKDDTQHKWFYAGKDRHGETADQMREIIHLQDGSLLWSDSGELLRRATIAEIKQQLQTGGDAKSPQRDWILALDFQQSRLVAELPLAECLNHTHHFFCAPGICLELGKAMISDYNVFLQAEVRSIWPSLVFDRPTYLSNACHWYATFVHDGKQEAYAAASDRVLLDHAISFILDPSAAVKSRADFGFEYHLPLMRLKLGAVTPEEWISHVKLRIWWPEFRGKRRFRVPAGEMAKLK